MHFLLHLAAIQATEAAQLMPFGRLVSERLRDKVTEGRERDDEWISD